jgi:hypothetical protein
MKQIDEKQEGHDGPYIAHINSPYKEQVIL